MAENQTTSQSGSDASGEQTNNKANSQDYLHYPADLQSKTRGHFVKFSIIYSQPVAYVEEIYSSAASFVSDNSDFSIEIPKSLSQFGSSIVSGVSEATKKVTNIAFNKQTRLDPSKQSIIKTISLYMPDTVNVSQTADWQSVDLTKVFGMYGLLGQVAPSILDSKNFSQAASSLASNPEYAVAALEGISMQEGVVEKKKSMIPSILMSRAGFAVNPQLEVLFKGVGLRSFQYQFIFTPVSQEESQQVKKIIEAFRMYSSPELSELGGGRYFKTPCHFGIEYLFLTGEQAELNPYLHKIKDCILESVYVDYSPEGWSTFRDGMPLQVRMTLQFRETQIVTRKDIQEGY